MSLKFAQMLACWTPLTRCQPVTCTIGYSSRLFTLSLVHYSVAAGQLLSIKQTQTRPFQQAETKRNFTDIFLPFLIYKNIVNTFKIHINNITNKTVMSSEKQLYPILARLVCPLLSLLYIWLFSLLDVHTACAKLYLLLFAGLRINCFFP